MIKPAEYYATAKDWADRKALLQLRSKLSGLYRQAARQFLLELAQNADDAYASWLHISLSRSESSGDRLIVTNDGEPFVERGFDSIIGAWDSPKAEDQAGKIGRFGVGFKSVYFHADCADLISGGFRYRMPKYPWPSGTDWPLADVPCPARLWGDSRMLEPADWAAYREELPEPVLEALEAGRPHPRACFVLHLEPGAADRIGQELSSSEGLNQELLLFLRHLKQIKITGFGTTLGISRKLQPWDGWKVPSPGLAVSDIAFGPQEAPSSVYRVYRRVQPARPEGDLTEAYLDALEASKVAIAIPVEQPGGAERALAEADPRRILWSWFPTETSLTTGFLVQGDFHLLQDRTALDDNTDLPRQQNLQAGIRVASLLKDILTGLCGGQGPLPWGWQKALLSSFHKYSHSYSGANYTASHLLGQLQETITAFLQSNPGLAAAKGGGVRTSAALLAVPGQWNEDQYSRLARLIPGNRLPSGIFRIDYQPVTLQGREWLAWPCMAQALAAERWRRDFGVPQVGRTLLANGCSFPDLVRSSNEWLEWMRLLAELAFQAEELPTLETGVRWPVIGPGDAAGGMEPIWTQGQTALEPGLYDPAKDNAALVKRIDTTGWTEADCAALLGWARGKLRLPAPDRRALILKRLEGQGRVDPTRAEALETFREILLWMRKEDRKHLERIPFVPVINGSGEPGLQCPGCCLLQPPEQELQAGFEAFLAATGKWAVDPDPFGLPMPAEGAYTPLPVLWLDTPLGRQPGATPRELLEAWGAPSALDPPTWNRIRSGPELDSAAASVNCADYKKGSRILHEPELPGLRSALNRLGDGGASSGALFAFLWNRLATLAARPQASAKYREHAADSPAHTENPLCSMLFWFRNSPHLAPVPDSGPIHQLRGNRWIPGTGTPRLAGEVTHKQLLEVLGESPRNAAGHAFLVDLLGLKPEATDLAELLAAAQGTIRYLFEKLGLTSGPAGGGADPSSGSQPNEPIEIPDPDPVYPDGIPFPPGGGPSEADGCAAQNRLVDLLGGQLIGFARMITPADEELSPALAASCLVSFHQEDLLRSEVRAADGKLLRDMLIEAALASDGTFKNDARSLFGINRAPRVSDFVRSWHPGGIRARWITYGLGLPPAFAGRPSDPKPPAEEVWVPLRNPGEARPYQLEYIRHEASYPMLIRIPTGSGKTRIAAERLLDVLNRQTQAPKAILWVAPEETLCEQAIETIKKLYDARSLAQAPDQPLAPLAFRRWFGGLEHDQVLHPEGHVVIATTYATLQRVTGKPFDQLASQVVLGVLDEAHRAVAASWEPNIRRLMRAGVPFLGLSATPDGAVTLLGQPIEIDYFQGESPQSVLSRDGVLAQPARESIRYAPMLKDLELPKEDLDQGEAGDAMPWRGRLAEHRPRREAILAWISAHLEQNPLEGRVLLFGANLKDALGLTAALKRANIKAEYVSSKTGSGAKRRIEGRFRAGELQVLCNYGIYTTGFDEPRITAVLIARPTLSRTLYTQMAGRGLRTTKTKRCCSIADVIDTGPARLARDDWWEEQQRPAPPPGP